MEWRELVAVDPQVQGGKPVVRGTRVPVQILVGSLAGGMTIQEVCEQYRVNDEQVRAALAYAAHLAQTEPRSYESYGLT
ncbi:MAG: DUF433 domain-containing protein [Armatimonadetes bacterium]|nr:DUF433 domain-containing protein [Armatimonadota bacterium]